MADENKEFSVRAKFKDRRLKFAPETNENNVVTVADRVLDFPNTVAGNVAGKNENVIYFNKKLPSI